MMTKFELTQLFWLKQEIKTEGQRLEELKAAAEGGVSHMDGMPRAGGQQRGKENAVISYVNQIQLVETKITRLTELYEKIADEIEAVPDSYMRQILTLRYVKGLSWLQVAMRLGGGNTPDGVRKAHDRFLKKQ